MYSVNAARRAAIFFCGAIFINKLDIRLFGYSISERARAPILREKGTVELLSIADGLREILTKTVLKKLRWAQKVRKKIEKKIEKFSLAKYHPGLVEKHYGSTGSASREALPRFLFQNVE